MLVPLAPNRVNDLRQGTLEEAWRTLVPKVRDLRSHRKEYLETCRTCPLVNLCLWRPARAHLETGELDSLVDYFCQDSERGVTEVACTAHARRKYFEAQSSDIMRPMVVLAYIHLLYDVEREARDGQLDAAGRLALRQARSRPLLQDLKAYLERERPHVLPKSPIAQAIAYTLSN